MWELNHKEGWVLKNWCFWTVVLEKTLESPLDSKEIKPVNPKGIQLWIFIGRTDVETPILWPVDVNSQLIGKDLDARKDWGQEEDRATEHEMTGWWFNGHELGWTPRDSEGQGGLACRNPWGHKESDTTEWLNDNSEIYSRNSFYVKSLMFFRCTFLQEITHVGGTAVSISEWVFFLQKCHLDGAVLGWVSQAEQGPRSDLLYLMVESWGCSWEVVHGLKWVTESHSVMSNSLTPHELYSPWNSPGQNTGVGSLSLFQGIFSTQGSNPGHLHCRWIPYQLSHRGRPGILEWVAYPFSSGSSQPRNWTRISCISGGFFTNWVMREAHGLK